MSQRGSGMLSCVMPFRARWGLWLLFSIIENTDRSRKPTSCWMVSSKLRVSWEMSQTRVRGTWAEGTEGKGERWSVSYLKWWRTWEAHTQGSFGKLSTAWMPVLCLFSCQGLRRWAENMWLITEAILGDQWEWFYCLFFQTLKIRLEGK